MATGSKENDWYLFLNESNPSFCLSFIRLVDYLVTSTFHQMVVKAVAQVLSVIQQRPCQSPSQGQSQSDSAEVSRTAARAEISIDHTPEVSRNNCSIFLGVFLEVPRGRNLSWSVGVHHWACSGHKSTDLWPFWGQLPGQHSAFSNRSCFACV